MNHINSGEGLPWTAVFWNLLHLTVHYSSKDYWNGFYQIAMSPITRKIIDFVKNSNLD